MSETQHPADWSLKTSLSLFYIKGRLGWKGLRASEFIEEGPYLVTGTDFDRGRVVWDRSFRVSMERYLESLEISLKEDDILITKDGTIGKVAYIDYVPFPGRASLNSHLFLVRSKTKDTCSRYCYHVFQSDKFKAFIESKKSGSTLAGLPQRVFEQFELPLPKLVEQRKIAKILSTVDNLIEKTQALIDKYQSIKQGMMHDLFTRGVDENGQLRPSYEEAPHLYKESELGWIPKEWEVKSLGTVSDKIQDGTHFSPQTTDGECLYVTSKNIRFGYMDLSNCGRISKYEHEQIYRRCDVKKGDILLTKDGANTGNAAINTVSEEFSLLSSVAIVRASDKVSDANYIVQYLLSPVGQNRLKDLMSGNAITRLTLTKIKAFIVAFAPYKEQVCIGKMLLSFDLKVSREKECLEKYKIIKAGLMQDLLTGKVRVKVDSEKKKS